MWVSRKTAARVYVPPTFGRWPENLEASSIHELVEQLVLRGWIVVEVGGVLLGAKPLLEEPRERSEADP